MAVVAAMAVGAVVAVLGSVVHQWTVGSQRTPLGVVVAVALTACVAVVLRAGRVGGVNVAATAAGWLAVVFLAATRRPEGDLLIPANGRGTAWVLLGAATLALASALAAAPARQARAARR